MKRTLPVLLCAAALLAAPPPVALGDGSGESLLERLSAETAALTAKADAQTAVLVLGMQRLEGVLVGDPARFVVALDDVPEHGDLPKDAKLNLADGVVLDATLLDADGEVGLAVYSITGPRRAGLALAVAATLKRGSLVVSVGGGGLGLQVLGDVGGPLEDLDLPSLPGTAALAPSGGLLGLVPSSAGARPPTEAGWEVAAADTLRASSYLALGRLADRTGAVVNDVRRLQTETEAMRKWLDAQNYRSDTRMPAFYLTLPALVRPGSGIVPAAVIERALADVSPEGGRFRRSYLGVVVDERMNAPMFTVPSADGRFLTRVAPDRSATVWNDWTPTIRTVAGGMASGYSASTVRLSSVLPDSPAAKAGLKAGLEIVEIDGRPFAGARGFARALARRRPGEEVRFTVRDWAEPVKVVLADREKEGRDLATAQTVGLTVLPLNGSLLAFFELPGDTSGVLVRNVDPGSPGALAGIERGDILQAEGGGTLVRDPGELDAILGAGKGAVVLKGRRGTQQVTFTLTLPDKITPRKTR